MPKRICRPSENLVAEFVELSLITTVVVVVDIVKRAAERELAS